MPNQALQPAAGSAEGERREVWVAMADHFLDTETRQDIPRTALRCMEAGLSVTQARLIWQYEVSPAVGHNLWNVAGEWAGWDRDWLVARVQQSRESWWHRPGTARWLRYRLLVHFNHGVWVSIARCMGLLASAAVGAERQQLARDLGLLFAQCGDFCPHDSGQLDAEQLARLRALNAGPFLHIVRPALLRGEVASAKERLHKALLGDQAVMPAAAPADRAKETGENRSGGYGTNDRQTP